MGHSLVFSTKEITEKEGLSFSEATPVSQWLGVEEVKNLEDLVGQGCMAGNCEVNIEFSVGGERILAEMEVSGNWEIACSRCLAPHQRAFENNMEETFLSSTEKIDLSQEVREMILLSFPSRSLCTPSCQGLCARCGKNLNRDVCSCSVTGGKSYA